jgi:hypothetical protein
MLIALLLSCLKGNRNYDWDNIVPESERPSMRTADQLCYLIINRIGIFGACRECTNYCIRITELIKIDVLPALKKNAI